MTQVLTYKYRLLPTKRQHCALASILEDQRQLYNAALEERIECHRKTGKSLSYMDQCKGVTACRQQIENMGNIPLNIQRGTIQRLDEAFKGFFRRVKAGDKPGFPRFRGKGWFNSFSFAEFSGIKLVNNRLYFKGLTGGLRVHFHRELPDGKILTAKFIKDAKGWHVCLAVRVETAEKKIVRSAVGIDVGIKTLAATSDGLLIPNPKAARKAQQELRRCQRQLARCKKGSNRRKKIKQKVMRLHSKIKNTRNTALHQISAMLTNRYDAIVVEALNIKGLSRGMLARDVHDASWGRLRTLMQYKAERAGVHFIEVDPKYTSQICPECGHKEPKTLSQRTHNCGHCGCVLDRDVAAARVILNRGVVVPEGHNVGDCVKRGSGNINFYQTETLQNGYARKQPLAIKALLHQAV